ncbi:hypothetical protein AB0H34_36130 [Saccharopolyspora shandongensis]|uniref:hypothetical protein n=1 Tax=Saccharopolyspora shandongensis TaxID=418495 RepID=UPI0033CD8AB7
MNDTQNYALGGEDVLAAGSTAFGGYGIDQAIHLFAREVPAPVPPVVQEVATWRRDAEAHAAQCAWPPLLPGTFIPSPDDKEHASHGLLVSSIEDDGYLIASGPQAADRSRALAAFTDYTCTGRLR